MAIDRRTLIGTVAGLTLASAAGAEQLAPPVIRMLPRDRPVWPPREHFPLWPGEPPNALSRLPLPNDTMNGPFGRRELWLRGVARPFLGVYRPAKPDGSALLVVPGGGYGFVSVQNEGIDVAHVMGSHGATVFVLAYRLPGEGWARHWDVPLQDAQRAMRLIRLQAQHWGVDPQRIGVLGFSAGGHLAASLAVGYDDPVYAPIDTADRLSARPAVAGLIYPVITISLDSRGGSYGNLIGPNGDARAIARYETDRRVNAGTPPIFLAQALDDGTVSPQNTLNMLAAARSARVPVEAHLFESGGHGFGALHLTPDHPAAHWPGLFDLWRKRHSGG